MKSLSGVLLLIYTGEAGKYTTGAQYYGIPETCSLL